jgi:hypothetical protein
VDVQLDKRNLLLSALVGLMMLVGAFFALTPEASALEKSDCPAGYVCVWEGPTFGGNRAFFAGSETGCHGLANINPRSAFNHTGNHGAIFPGLVGLGPGESFSNLGSPYTGELCIT